MATCYLLYSVWFNDDYNAHVNILEEVSLNESALLNIKNCKELEQSANNLLYTQALELRGIYDELYRHNRPEYPSHLLLKVPKWKGLSKVDITQEMRAERDRVNQHNIDVTKKHWEETNAYDEARDTSIRTQLNLPSDFNFSDLRLEDCTWKIESKEFV